MSNIYRINYINGAYEDVIIENCIEKKNISWEIIYKNKLFHNDLIEIINLDDFRFNLKSSPIRSEKFLFGILIRYQNRTYGKIGNKHYYKCKPLDKNLPYFLVGSRINQSHFIKDDSNEYIRFLFINWEDKIPVAELVETIGKVNNVKDTIEYWVQSSNCIFGHKQISKLLYKNGELDGDKISESIQNKFNIKERNNEYILSIDPSNCVDIDDAFSISDNTLSIYISATAVVIDYLNLWNHLTDQVSTLYLPEEKKSIFPSKLSDNILSLLESKKRLVLALDIISLEGKYDYKFSLKIIKVSKNISYDFVNSKVKKVLKNTKNFLNKWILDNDNMTFGIHNLDNTHDLIAFMMVLYNYKAASILKSKNINLVYREISFKSEYNENFKNLSLKEKTNINNYFLVNGFYSLNNNFGHSLLRVSQYTHITSPIRRLVDQSMQVILLHNIIKFKFNKNGYIWLDKILKRIDIINEMSKKIKKIESKSNLLKAVESNNDIINVEKEAIILEKTGKIKDRFYQYSVYLKDFNLFSCIYLLNEIEQFSVIMVKLIYIQSGENIRKKIKLELV